jgi:hypothetical protein
MVGTKIIGAVAAVGLLVLAQGAMAGERPIGEAVEKGGMKVGAVYLQGVLMDPQTEMCGPNDADIHLEADIHGLKGNPNGFAAGEWIPYLGVTYVLTKPGSDFVSKGPLVPMVADDGPHYGRNVKMAGPGKYHLAITVQPPSTNGFYRHTDKETGVAQWWQPFTQEWDFTYVGSTGKKGGY